MKIQRGFAIMTPEKRQTIAAMGVAHKWTSEEARAAGIKGGRNKLGKKK